MTNSEIIDAVKKLESDLKTYNNFVEDKGNSEDLRRVVSFKMLYDMISMNTLLQFVEYKPSEDITILISNGLKGATGFVTIVNDRVEISQEYKDILALKEQYQKTSKN